MDHKVVVEVVILVIVSVFVLFSTTVRLSPIPFRSADRIGVNESDWRAERNGAGSRDSAYGAHFESYRSSTDALRIGR